eukprot:TRINITY_DN973_c0_g1_i4.p1 TRINITY_DN973_c0_g1~~TRINITY_DN973_c0_g1_i4.p1  ORF type:complete len:380 (+),score=63.71 TRINITY_DN973_c0_g1_i4:152-1291(+)
MPRRKQKQVHQKRKSTLEPFIDIDCNDDPFSTLSLSLSLSLPTILLGCMTDLYMERPTKRKKANHTQQRKCLIANDANMIPSPNLSSIETATIKNKNKGKEQTNNVKSTINRGCPKALQLQSTNGTSNTKTINIKSAREVDDDRNEKENNDGVLVVIKRKRGRPASKDQAMPSTKTLQVNEKKVSSKEDPKEKQVNQLTTQMRDAKSKLNFECGVKLLFAQKSDSSTMSHLTSLNQGLTDALTDTELHEVLIVLANNNKIKPVNSTLSHGRSKQAKTLADACLAALFQYPRRSPCIQTMRFDVDNSRTSLYTQDKGEVMYIFLKLHIKNSLTPLYFELKEQIRGVSTEALFLHWIHWRTSREQSIDIHLFQAAPCRELR